MPYDSQKKGFTLIELLVVIAIIAILSVIGMTQLASAREKARDSQRRIDLSQYQHILVSYYDDHGNVYPMVSGDKTGAQVLPDHSKTDAAAATGVFHDGGAIVPTYLKQEVFDPFLGRDGHEYFYIANCNVADCTGQGATDYLLYTKMEIGNYYYSLGPAGRITDVPDKKLTAPTCPGTAGTATDDCIPPS